MSDFVNLHSHTHHSHMDAIIRIPDLFKRVVELGQSGIAITDHGVLSGIHEGYKEYKKYRDQGKDIKFIPGSEIYFCDDLNDPKSKRRHLVLLAQNEEGYRNLLKLNAAGFNNSVNVMGRPFPRVDFELLKKHSAGLFVNSACGGSPFAAAIFEKNYDKAVALATKFQDIWGEKFHIELQPHDLKRGEFNQGLLNEQLFRLANDLKISLIATCDSHYLTSKHEKYHDMALAIGSKKSLEDPTRHRYASYDPCLTCAGTGVSLEDSKTECTACGGSKYAAIKPCPEFYLKDRKSLEAYFTKKFDATSARQMLDNTVAIAKQCEYPDYMKVKGHLLPAFPWKDEPDSKVFTEWRKGKDVLNHLSDDAAYLRYVIKKGFDKLTTDFDKDKKTIYWERVKKELDILEGKNFSSYLLIVADYIRWARNKGIRVGHGRGSVGGSLVAYILGIHQADPIKYGLLFERFQNKEKTSLPDIDVDFAPSGREQVIDYCRNKYGAANVAYISNILRLTPKLLIKDIARSLVIGGDKSTSFKIANDITASIPDIIMDGDKRIKVDTMEKAMGASEKLRKFLATYPVVLEYANELVGTPRGFATHAAGVIISKVPLDECAPLRRDKDGNVSIQYDKDTCEEVGLVKMDFLGLDTLDVLDETIALASSIGMELPLPEQLEDGDPKAYKLIHSGYTTGLFQLNGSMTPLCKAMQPKSIPDIAHISAIGRPSVAAKDRMSFINRRSGREKVRYAHPVLESVLKQNYGIAIYEEDLLRIAQHVAGWDLSDADGLRKMTKSKEKGADLAVKLKKKFIEGSVAHSKITPEDAEIIWTECVEKFSGYGFNLSHAIMYSMISYHTAYYKAHAPTAFICANLNSQTRGNKPDKDEIIDELKKDAKSFKINILPCDVNLSKEYYSLRDRQTIITGLGAIKGIGDIALKAIIANQPYSSLEDFLYRTPSSVNKTVIEALAKSGAMDSLGVSRKYIIENFANIKKELAAYSKKVGVETVVETEELVEEAIETDEFSDDYDGGTTSTVRLVPKKKVKKTYQITAEQLAEFVPKNMDGRKDEYSLRDKLQFEKEVLGYFLSGDMGSMYPGFFVGGRYSTSYTKLQSMVENINFPTEGIISSIKEIIIKKSGKNHGKTMCKMVLENLKGETVDISVWADQYERLKTTLKVGLPIRGMFKVNEYGGAKSLVLINLEAVYKKTGES